MNNMKVSCSFPIIVKRKKKHSINRQIRINTKDISALAAIISNLLFFSFMVVCLTVCNEGMTKGYAEQEEATRSSYSVLWRMRSEYEV